MRFAPSLSEPSQGCVSVSRALGLATCTLIIAGQLSGKPSHAAQYNPPPTQVLTHRYNNKRTGANLTEHALNVQAVSSPEFQKLYTIPVAGQVYAEPLLVPQLKWPDGTTKNVLIVATMTNQVYAFQVDDAIHGAPFSPVLLWTVILGQPVRADFMPMASSVAGICSVGICFPSDDPPPSAPALPPVGTAPTIVNTYGFYNINPWIGVVSTPVIDAASQTLYVVCKQVSPNGGEFNRLFELNLLSGQTIKAVAIGVEDSIASVPGTSSDSQAERLSFFPKMQMNRPALLLQSGQVYVAFGSHQDTRPWHGWIFSYDAKTLQRTAVWCSTPNGMGGSIWQAGNGIAGGDDGSIYVMTGNGDEDPEGRKNFSDSTNSALGNFGEHFVQLDRNLSVIGSFAPSNVNEMDSGDEDLDLGSSGPVLFPEQTNGNILFGGGKDSRLFVLDTNTHLGMRQIFQAGAPKDLNTVVKGLAYHHIHGAPVLWRSSKNGMNLYVWPERDVLRQFHWNDNAAVLDCKNKIGAGGAEVKCQDIGTPLPITIPFQASTVRSPTCTVVPILGCWSMPGGILSISAEGDASGTGILWASMPKNDDALYNIVPGELRALDAEDITHELWNSEMNAGRDGNFMFAKYNPPVVANGRVYLATFGSTLNQSGGQTTPGSVNVYGLRQWAKYIGDGGHPPPSSLKPDEKFTTQLVFFNSGTTVWKKGVFRLGSQSPQDGTAWAAGRFELPNDVNPGEQVTIELSLTAPHQLVAGCRYQQPSGTPVCDYQWRMVQENVEWFGDFAPKISIPVLLPPRICTPRSGLQCCEKDDYGNCTVCLTKCTQ